MATIQNRRTRTRTHGDAQALETLMVTSAMLAARFRPADQIRAAELHVRAAIRRDGFTDAGEQLVLTPDERAAWDARNPTP